MKLLYLICNLFYFFIADEICNCPVPSYLNPKPSTTTTTTTTSTTTTLDYSLNIGQIHPFPLNSKPEGHDYTTIVSHKNCDIRYPHIFCNAAKW